MLEANIVRDFKIGNTRIKIADDYCRRSASEIEQLLNRAAAQAQAHFNVAAARGQHTT